MKKLKVLTAILLALMFVLFAMGSGSGEPVENDDIVINDSVDIDIDEPTEAPVEQKKVSRGTIAGDVYTNDFVGVTFSKPADWTYATDEEIAQTVNVGQDLVDLNAFEEALSETTTIYDMYALDDYGNSVALYYQNTLFTTASEINLDDFEALLISSLMDLTAPTYEFENSEDVTLGDTTFRKTTFTATYEGVTLTQAYYVTLIDQYAVTFILTSRTMDIAEMEAMLS